jgi:hypothetical protein
LIRKALGQRPILDPLREELPGVLELRFADIPDGLFKERLLSVTCVEYLERQRLQSAPVT